MSRKYDTTLGFFTAAADPATPAPVIGDTYYNTTTNTLRWYNGTTWVEAATRSLAFFMG